MKKVFNFQDRKLELEIAGKNFSITCDEKLAVKLQGLQKRFNEFADPEKVKGKTMAEITDVCKEITDSILGANAFAGIFGKRKHNAQDGIDVVVFLMNSIAEKYREQKIVNFVPQGIVQNPAYAAINDKSGLPS